MEEQIKKLEKQIKKLREKLILFQQRDNIFMNYSDKLSKDDQYNLNEDLMKLIVEEYEWI